MASTTFPTGSSPWPTRWLTLLLWALAAASVVAWSLRLSTPVSSMAATVGPQSLPAPDAQAIARLLGAVSGAPSPTAAPAAANRFVLIGVLAGKNGASGAALMAVGGQPARTFRIGAVVDGDLVLQAISPKGVELGVSGAAPSVSVAFAPQP